MCPVSLTSPWTRMAKTTEWQNELKPTENELKTNICLLILCLNHFDESKHMFGRTLGKRFGFCFSFLRYSKVDLQTSTYIFYKSAAPEKMQSAAFGTVLWKSAFCGSQICLFCGLGQYLHSSLYSTRRNIVELKTWLRTLQKQLPEVFYKKGVLKSFSKFTGKYLSLGVFLLIFQNF